MKHRKILAVLLLSVFCLSGCSDRYRDVIEKDMETEQTTTASASGDKTSESDKKDEEKKTEEDEGIPMPDMSEEWEIRYGGEQYCNGTDDIACDTYGFINKSGYQFACSVFLPDTAKDGKDCPVILMNNGLQSTWSLQESVFQVKKGAVPDADGNYKEEDLEKTEVKTPQISVIYASYRPEILLAKALNDEGIGLIIIEPFESIAVYNTFWAVSKEAGDSDISLQPQGGSFQINYAVDKAFMDIVLNNIGEISGADPSKVILASRDYHNIAATQLAAQNQDKISGLVMIDPCTGLTDKIRKEYPEKESLKGIDEPKAGMAMDYLYDLYDIDLKEESSKLNINTKIFISDELKKADTTDPKYDRGIVNDTLASIDSAKEFYPNSAPEAVDTSDFIFTSTPSSEQTNSITKIVSFCKMLANQ